MPSLDDEPVILGVYTWLWQAFSSLSVRRLRGHEHTPQYIQVSEIKAYCDFHMITNEAQRELLDHVVSALDHVYMASHWKAMKAILDKTRSRIPH